MKIQAFVLCALGLLVGCQTPPTKTVESSKLDPRFLLKRLDDPVQLSELTFVIDARSAFDFNTARIPGSVNLSWEDFSRKSAAQVERLARRLALYGLHPDAEVVVVGRGKGGQGEDGRLAWSLLHLGFKNVQLAGFDLFKAGMNNAETPLRPNAPFWKPALRPELEANASEVLSLARQVLEEGQRKSKFLLDVRTRKEYFLKKGLGEGYVTPDLNALHIPWTEFLTDEGRPNRNVRSQLLALGWQPNDRIVVISDRGVRSGAVAFALMNLGFTNVANFTGGYQELSSGPLKGPKLRPLGK